MNDVMYSTSHALQLQTEAFFFSENLSVYDTMWKNTGWIFLFPLQQWLREHSLMLCYVYIAYLV
jgi:hypothetical protein